MIGKKINQLATELAPVSTDLTIIGDPISGVSKKITLAQLGAIFSGAVSFYTNLASFPAVGDINVIYCAKDTQKLYLWSGSAYVEVFPSQALLDTYQLRSEKGVSNGYASLDSGGKVPISQLPSSIMEYKGMWNAATNTPTLANGTGDTGDVYICNVAGTVNFGAGPITFAVGDYVIYSGSIWQRSSGAVGTVTSVGLSITGDSIGVSNSPITTSGTLALAFSGTSAQYINGAGNLINFPTSLISGSGLSGQVTFFNGANSVTGSNNLFYDTTNNRLGIGLVNPQRSLEIFNATADAHLRLSGNAPSVSMGEAVTGSIYQAKFGLVTTNGQFASAGVAGDFVIISQTGATIFVTNSTEKMRVNASGNMSVGNTNNTYRLDVTGTGRFTGQLRLESTITDGTNTYTLPSATGTLALVSQIPSVTGFVPYTGATANVDLGTHTLSAYNLIINHTSGSGVAASITKGGNGEALTVVKSSGSGNAASITGGVTLLSELHLTTDLADAYIASASNWNDAYNLRHNAVTIGTANGLSLSTQVLSLALASGSTTGALSSTDWTTFNNKQNALTNPVTGTGTNNFIPKFTTTGSTIGNSQIFDDGTNVGIGTTTLGGKFQVKIATDLNVAFNETGGVARISAFNDAISASIPLIINGDNLRFGTGGNINMLLNASGNLGLGVTPSAWASGFTALQVKNASFWSTGNDASITANSYYDGSNYRYIATAGASRTYHNTDGSIIWSQAPSGTAGNAISFTQAMLLNASGNLSVGNTNDSFKLDVSGTGRFTGAVTAAGALFTAATETRGNIRTTFSSDNSYFSIFSNDGALTLDTYGVGGFMNFKIAGTTRLTIASTGAATFSSSVTAGGASLFNAGSGTLSADVLTVRGGGGTGAFGFKVEANNGEDIFYTDNFSYNVITNPVSGKFGIGTTSPSEKLHINRTDGAGVYIRLQDNSGSRYLGNDAGAMVFLNGSASEQMRITSGGNVEINTGSIKTGAPTNGTAQPWKLGNAVAGSVSTDTHIIVSINGTTYSIPAFNGLP